MLFSGLAIRLLLMHIRISIVIVLCVKLRRDPVIVLPRDRALFLGGGGRSVIGRVLASDSNIDFAAACIQLLDCIPLPLP